MKIDIQGTGNVGSLYEMLAWIELIGERKEAGTFSIHVDGTMKTRWKFVFEDEGRQTVYNIIKKNMSECPSNEEFEAIEI